MKNLSSPEPGPDRDLEQRLVEIRALLERLRTEIRPAAHRTRAAASQRSGRQGTAGRREGEERLPAFAGPWGFDIPLGG